MRRIMNKRDQIFGIVALVLAVLNVGAAVTLAFASVDTVSFTYFTPIFLVYLALFAFVLTALGFVVAGVALAVTGRRPGPWIAASGCGMVAVNAAIWFAWRMTNSTSISGIAVLLIAMLLVGIVGAAVSASAPVRRHVEVRSRVRAVAGGHPS